VARPLSAAIFGYDRALERFFHAVDLHNELVASAMTLYAKRYKRFVAQIATGSHSLQEFSRG